MARIYKSGIYNYELWKNMGLNNPPVSFSMSQNHIIVLFTLIVFSGGGLSVPEM